MLSAFKKLGKILCAKNTFFRAFYALWVEQSNCQPSHHMDLTERQHKTFYGESVDLKVIDNWGQI